MKPYRDDVAASHGESECFAALYGTDQGRLVRAVFVGPDGATRTHSAEVEDGAVPSIVDIVPAAGWDEREAHDLYGIQFSGHDPLRPLLDHDQPLERWTVPVRGRDTYQVAVGPIHAGVIESGHFRFHVVGDRILHLDARLFYKHRGLETAAEGVPLTEGMIYVSRACAACSVTNAVASSDACEQILGLQPPTQLSRARTILIELERVWNHLNDIAAICAGVGLAAGNNALAALTERARRLNQALSSHRFLRGAVMVGRSELHWDAATIRTAREELGAIRSIATRHWRELAFNASFQDRLNGVGVIDAAQATILGVVGPAARAAGKADDTRSHSPRLTYEHFAPVIPEQPDGDVRARYEQRALELWQSFDLLDDLLDHPVSPTRAEPSTALGESGVGIVEGPRGRTVCVVESDGDRIGRLHLRTASFANWPAVAAAAAGNLLPDLPLINNSFELCYACADR